MHFSRVDQNDIVAAHDMAVTAVAGRQFARPHQTDADVVVAMDGKGEILEPRLDPRDPSPQDPGGAEMVAGLHASVYPSADKTRTRVRQRSDESAWPPHLDIMALPESLYPVT